MRNALRNLHSLVRATVLLVALAGSAVAQTVPPAPLRSLEEAIETSTDAVLLPLSVPGTLTFKNCTAPCAIQSLEVSAATQFMVGATAVSVAEFRSYVEQTGEQFLMVFHKPGERSVTRVVAFGRIDRR